MSIQAGQNTSPQQALQQRLATVLALYAAVAPKDRARAAMHSTYLQGIRHEGQPPSNQEQRHEGVGELQQKFDDLRFLLGWSKSVESMFLLQLFDLHTPTKCTRVSCCRFQQQLRSSGSTCIM